MAPGIFKMMESLVFHTHHAYIQKEVEVRNLYLKRFFPTEYLNQYYSELDAEVEFFLRNLHYIFAEGKLSTVPAGKLLEIGCGPVIINVLSASAWTTDITMADLVPRNRCEIQRWWKEEQGAGRWSKAIEFVAALEDQYIVIKYQVSKYIVKILKKRKSRMNEPKDSRHVCYRDPDDIWKRLKSRISKVVPCDVHHESPLLADHKGTYQVVVTSLCLEFASTDPEHYKRSLQNVLSIIEEGGYLVMQGALGNHFYNVEEEEFPSVCLTSKMLQELLEALGMKIIQLQTHPRVCKREEKAADHEGIFFVCAQRSNKTSI